MGSSDLQWRRDPGAKGIEEGQFMPFQMLRNRKYLVVFSLMLAIGSVVPSARAQNPWGSARTRQQVIDFSQFKGQRLETNGPLDVGFGVVWTALQDGWVGDMSFGLRTNGFWNGGREGFAGLNAANSAMLFTFDDPVNRIMAFVNYAPLTGQGSIPTIEALDVRGRVIDSVTVDIRTPNGVNDGEFLSFEHETDDIFAFRYRARYGVLDDLTWSRTGHRGIIPGPSSLSALGVVFLGFGCRRRRAS